MTSTSATSSPATAYAPIAPPNQLIDFDTAIMSAQIKTAIIQEKKLHAAMAEMKNLNTRLEKLNEVLSLTESLLHVFCDEPDPEYKRFLGHMRETTDRLKSLFTELEIAPEVVFGNAYTEPYPGRYDRVTSSLDPDALRIYPLFVGYRYQFDNISFAGYKYAVENAKNLVDALSNDQKEAMVKLQKLNNQYSETFETMTKSQKNSAASIESIIGRM